MHARLITSSCLIALVGASAAAGQEPGANVGGEVPGLLGLSVTQPTGLAAFPPGTRPSGSRFVSLATSTEPGAALTVADGDVLGGARLGRLTAGGRTLAAPLEVRADGGFVPLGLGRVIVPFPDVVAARPVTVSLRQRLATTDRRRGTWRKTIIASLNAPAAAPPSARAAALAGADAPGRLTLSPAVIATVAAAGRLGTFEVRNTTSAELAVTVTTRPWHQERTGEIRIDRAATLTRWVRPDVERFALTPGGSRAVGLTVTAVPPRGSVFGALEVVAVPSGARRPGVTTATGLAAAMRLGPAPTRRSYRFVAGPVRAAGSRLVLPVRNAGSTADAVRGRLQLSGPGVRRTIPVPATTVLPGASVDLRTGVRFRAGTWRVSYRLTQAGRTVTSGSRAIRLR